MSSYSNVILKKVARDLDTLWATIMILPDLGFVPDVNSLNTCI